MLRDEFMAHGVRFDAVWSSPLDRAMETASIITGGKPESRGSYWSNYIGNCGVYRMVYADGIFSVPEEIYTGLKMLEELG